MDLSELPDATRVIQVSVECGAETFQDFQELPPEWDTWDEDKQNRYLTECAVDFQNEMAPCGARVVDRP